MIAEPKETLLMDAAPQLSEREQAVLRGIAEDKTYAQIAHCLGVSHETVKSYASRLRAKLGIDTKVGLALYWERNLKEAS